MKQLFFTAKLIIGCGCLLILNHEAQCQTGPGNALQLDGTSEYVQAPAITSGGGGITVEAWVKPVNLSSPCEQVIVQAGSTPTGPVNPLNSSSNDFQLRFWGCGTLLVFSCRVAVGFGFASREMSVSINPSDFMDGKWHHFAGTYSADTTTAVYRDGQKIAEMHSGGNYPPAVIGSHLAIGATFDGTAAASYFAGGIDEVRIWTKARTAEEICQTLNRRLAGNEPSLAGYWRLDEGTGATTSDSSGHGLTGVLLNGPSWIASGALNAIPVVTTGVASNITANAAALTGSASVCSLATSAWFEYGTNSSYGQSTPAFSVGQGSQPASLVQVVSGLDPDTVYHFRAWAMNLGGASSGPDQQLKTAGPPKPTTLPPVGVTPKAATLQASVDPDGLETSAWFEWGTNTSYGATTPFQMVSAVGKSTIVQPITGLASGVTYHYRAAATNNAGIVFGQDHQFTPAFSNTFVGCWGGSAGSVAWGDYDRNGYLDLLVTKGDNTNVHTCLFRNDAGALTFVPDQSWPLGFGSAGLPAVQRGFAGWGDFDNDGAVDVLLAGYIGWWGSGEPTCQIFHNEKTDMFTGLVSGFVGVGRSCGAVGDYNNDGFVDFVVTGTTGSYYASASPTNILYRNNGNGTFTNVQAGLPAVFDGDMAWGDYDSDGQLDLALVGNTGTSNIARIYRNSQGVFTDIGANLAGVCRGSVAWGDYNNNGELDLLLVGQTNTDSNISICRIYQNDHGTFTDIGAGLPGVSASAAAWGDFDRDGYLDVLVSGLGISRIYRNADGVFVDIQTGLAGAGPSAVAWGDYDNDGRLDLAIDGNWGGVVIYRNFVPLPINNPAQQTAPAGLESVVVHNSVTLRWNAASDPHTPTPGLTYNVRVGTTPGGGQVVPPQSDPVTGQRRIPQMGNAEHRLFSMVTNIPVGLYYWSVQAVNHAFAGSPWAPEQTFAVTSGPPVVVTQPASNVLCCSALLSGFVTPGVLPTLAWFEWGTSTNFGNTTPRQELETGLQPLLVLHPLPGLQPRTPYFFRLVATNVTGLVLGTNLSFTTEGPAPLVSTLTATNIGYTSATPFGASPLASPIADCFIEWGTTTDYGHLAATTINDAALHFDGVDDSVATDWAKFPTVTNNFTIELWVNPAAARPVTVESIDGIAGYGGQRYAVFPEGGVYGGGSHAGAGLSVGTNGVSAMEHAENYLPSVLVYSNGVTGWSHLALVYSNHLPMLFVNATLVRTGLVSSRIVHPSAGFGGMTTPWNQFGPFAGEIQEARIWDVPLDASTIQAWMNQGITTNHPAYSHLRGYWPLSEGSGTNAADKSPLNNPGQLLNGTAWTAGRHSSAREFSAVLGGLAPDTTYHFRAIAINPGGSAHGEDRTFTTLSLPRVLGVTVQNAPATTGSLLRFSGSAGFGYVMEASTNLVDWLALTNLVAGPDGLFEFLDTSTTNFPTRFYRLRVP